VKNINNKISNSLGFHGGLPIEQTLKSLSGDLVR
jgi:hypothetical protein